MVPPIPLQINGIIKRKAEREKGGVGREFFRVFVSCVRYDGARSGGQDTTVRMSDLIATEARRGPCMTADQAWLSASEGARHVAPYPRIRAHLPDINGEVAFGRASCPPNPEHADAERKSLP